MTIEYIVATLECDLFLCVALIIFARKSPLVAGFVACAIAAVISWRM